MLRIALCALGGLALLGIAYIGFLIHALSGDAAICRMNLELHAAERQRGEPISTYSTLCRNIRAFCPDDQRPADCTPG